MPHRRSSDVASAVWLIIEKFISLTCFPSSVKVFTNLLALLAYPVPSCQRGCLSILLEMGHEMTEVLC